MKFCSKCDSALSHTHEGLKCRKCDSINPNPALITQKIEDTLLTDKEFPCIQDLYYMQKLIRNHFKLSTMRGINVKENLGMIILFRYVHKKVSGLKSSQSNVYLDKFDEKSGIYHYVGEGLTDNQTMSNGNIALKCAKDTGLDVHLFWQHHDRGGHQYVGKVNVQGISTENQPDKNNKMRNVFVFSLKPEDVI